MSTFNDISGLMIYAGRLEWTGYLDDVLEEHFGAAMNIFDIEYDDIPGLIGDHWMSTLWGCAFEDLLTRSVGPDRVNIVDDFLKHRGWNEKIQDKIYMKALRGSVMSLYEISDVVPGTSMLIRDMIRGGDPILVSERSATRSLKQWDKLAARIVATGKKSVISGGMLASPRKPRPRRSTPFTNSPEKPAHPFPSRSTTILYAKQRPCSPAPG